MAALAIHTLFRCSTSSSGSSVWMQGPVGVPSTNGRRFGLPVAIGTAAPIFFLNDLRVDLPSVIVVYGAGMAIGGLIFSIRPTSKADSSVLRSLVGMTVYAIVFSLVRQSELVQAIQDGWRVLVPLVIAVSLAPVYTLSGWARRKATSADPLWAG